MAYKKRVLFLCTHNSARSQMAEGLLRAFYGERYESCSAGIQPTRMDPRAVKAMAEVGIDIQGQKSKGLDEFLGKDIDLVVTICDGAREACPYFPGAKKTVHRGFEDPAAFEGSEEEVMEAFRRVREQIRGWMKDSFGWEGKPW